MLELKGITKEYHTGGEVVHALKGIDLKFRKSEFVAILGQSGCGKTTMLNIIGGLDQYTNGDLIINGKSTKMYNDRDWDGYRNHSIGFVFQSYNLIPHQTVLQNVEIALTLSGVSKKERRQRAIDALTSVGLKSQLNKRPAEMSGGQMQRVAMARAIVNNPDIILADEPTGALDTETSVQVMDILKEISKDRLVIMVTHNPELAEKYATRTIRMLDGLITADSNPLTEEETEILRKEDEEILERTKNIKEKKPSMSLFTSFGLSLKNLFTKMGRTALTSFAGSIGIIGIALIYAVSNGMTTYIDIVQEETLSSYPLTLQAQTYDLTSIMQTVMDMSTGESTHEKDAVYEKSIVYELVQAISGIETSENDLGAFKEYLDKKLADTSESGNPLKNSISGVSYSYDLRLKLFTKNIDGKINQVDPTGLMQKLITGSSSVGGAGAFDSTGASYAALMGGGGFT
ncbi:MAG: ABC transporter ATP-binding protein, partial [Clostridia bacterium]|nr:ABC transporter ATP-binding protein [Clostridia bacterium]